MKITLLTPNVDISGGVKIILGYADRLAKRGHTVTVICPQTALQKKGDRFHSPENLERSYVSAAAYRPGWIDVAAEMKYVPSYGQEHVPDADIVVATAWQTAEYVAAYPAHKGKKFYLFMHYERLFTDGCSDVDTFTYSLPLQKVVISSCLREFLKKKFNEESEVIPCPVDEDYFYSIRKQYHKDKVICMAYHAALWKGALDGIKAFEMVQKKYPRVTLTTFGARNFEMIPGHTHYQGLTNVELRSLYNNADIFMCSSWREGFGLPAAEAMACKCAVVTTDNGGSRDYAIHEKTALVCGPQQPEKLAENIIRLLENEALLERIAESGYRHIKSFNWDNAVNRIQHIFQKCS